jgi:hypothetical protein
VLNVWSTLNFQTPSSLTNSFSYSDAPIDARGPKFSCCIMRERTLALSPPGAT